jgi:hypothetical protein
VIRDLIYYNGTTYDNRLQQQQEKKRIEKDFFDHIEKLIANLSTGTSMKDSLNKLTCYNAQATTVVLVTRRTAVLLKAERKREVNNQA